MHFTDPSKYGIRFRLENREKFNAMHLGNAKRAPKQYNLSRLAARKLNRRNSIDVEHCSPSSITRVIVSKKKMTRTTRILTHCEEQPLALEESAGEKTMKDEIKEALRKIRGFGLLMREFRGDMLASRSKSLCKSKRPRKDRRGKKDPDSVLRSNQPSEDPDDAQRRTSFEKLFEQDSIKPRRESILQTFNNISSFVSALMKEAPNSQEAKERRNANEDCKEVPEETVSAARKRSSFYSNLSEGSLTDSNGSESSEEEADRPSAKLPRSAVRTKAGY